MELAEHLLAADRDRFSFNDDQRKLGICSVDQSDSLQIWSVSGKICKESLRAWQLERKSAGAKCQVAAAQAF